MAFSQLCMISFVTWPPLQLLTVRMWPSDKANHKYSCENALCIIQMKEF